MEARQSEISERYPGLMNMAPIRCIFNKMGQTANNGGVCPRHPFFVSIVGNRLLAEYSEDLSRCGG